MIRSMTGYSTASVEAGAYSLSLSLKGTNHRYLDLQMRLPMGLDFLDPEIRRMVKERVLRGHVELTVALESHDNAALRLDRKLLEAYLQVCQNIRQEFSLAAEPDVVALLRIPGVVAGGSELDEAERGKIRSVLERGLRDALERFNEMRELEGATLERDLKSRLKSLEDMAAAVTRLSASTAPAFRQRLEKRLRELSEGIGMDPGRIAQEVTALVMRSDITEEVTRFKSHLGQAKHLLEDGRETGKRFDFLLQEMNREANTMLSKTTDVPDAGLKIQDAAIEMKVEIEKLREQIQNIE
ncbi:MAG: YicC/YloC family endoribonuclease [Terriglobia bacterium]